MFFNYGFPPDWSSMKKLIWLRGSGASGGLLPWTEFTGNPIEFDAPKSHSLKSCVIEIEPIQSGSGDPSPDNVRPISGWTEAKLWDEAEYEAQANPKLTIPFGQTVYGATASYNGDGTWTVTSWYNVDSGKWSEFKAKTVLTNYTRAYLPASAQPIDIDPTDLCNIAPFATGWELDDLHFYTNGANSRLYIWLPNDTDGDTEITFCYKRVTQMTFTVSNAQLFDALQGRNVMWTDCSNLTVEAKGTAVTP